MCQWDENKINVVEFAKKIEQAGADRITVHGRTKEQGYSGKVNQEAILNVKEAVSIPVIANGDIVSKETAEEMLLKTKADGVMVARGLLGRPWLLNQIKGENIPSYPIKDIVLEHLELMLSYYGAHGLIAMRKHLAWYASTFEGKASFCNQVFAQKEIDKVKKIIKDFFKETKIEEIR